MKTFFNTLPFISEDSLVPKIFGESALFFDIETTGFSAKHTRVYLIGCACRRGPSLHISQFFSDSEDAEDSVIREFLSLLEKYQTLISFNGSGFDIPYLKERCKALNIPERLDSFSHLDIFKVLSPYKKILKLPNLKQKTLEEFLGTGRKDPYSGGELINLYQDYLLAPEDEKLDFMLLHNSEDVTGMYHLLSAFSYAYFFQGNFDILKMEKNQYEEYEGTYALELLFTLRPDFDLPKRISYGRDFCYLSGVGSRISLRIKIYQGELKYFYSNYRDYYYLPQEDMAVHKSVAFYVDKDYRTKAKAATCYSKKTGCFLPQYTEVFTPYFKLEYHDKISYFEMTEEFTDSLNAQKKYVLHLLQLLLYWK